ncbi:MAG TPA: cell division protein ZapA [Candidatus Dependentiae bacterium]|nr:cell division protein ZapA [Candidatus Dependentiae bacterium]HRQ62479.1 cell division protein ZapA [Candidatus Dependentiae bacterium]
MKEKKRYTVQIMDGEYTLVSDEAEQHIRQSAAKVDDIMRSLSELLQNVEPKKIAVLTALRIASELINTQESVKAIERKEAALIDRIDQELLTPLS